MDDGAIFFLRLFYIRFWNPFSYSAERLHQRCLNYGDPSVLCYTVDDEEVGKRFNVIVLGDLVDGSTDVT